MVHCCVWAWIGYGGVGVGVGVDVVYRLWSVFCGFCNGQAMRKICARDEMEQTMLATHETYESPF